MLSFIFSVIVSIFFHSTITKIVEPTFQVQAFSSAIQAVMLDIYFCGEC